MAQTVDEMISDILRREGGFVNDPDDRGGPTKYGITQKTLSRFLGRAMTVENVRNLSEDLAREIYERNYFYGPGLHKLPTPIQPFVFDSAVNHGPRRALRFVQSVCNQAGLAELDEDGIMGPQTQAGANVAQQEMGDWFLKALVEERRMFYHAIVANNGSQEKFLKGWLNRINEFDLEVA